MYLYIPIFVRPRHVPSMRYANQRTSVEVIHGRKIDVTAPIDRATTITRLQRLPNYNRS